PISAAQMNAKHEVLFPEALVRGKTVLDLGCCIGTTGHWCLTLGATSYTGVELQPEYVSIARTLLGKHHPGKFAIHESAIEAWLASADSTYDVVSILGVIYVFSDYYSVLKRIAELARETIVIEGLYHDVARLGLDFCGVAFINAQSINLADQKASLF